MDFEGLGRRTGSALLELRVSSDTKKARRCHQRSASPPTPAQALIQIRVTCRIQTSHPSRIDHFFIKRLTLAQVWIPCGTEGS